MSTNELIIEMLEKMDRKLDQYNQKLEDKFNKLPCGERIIRLDRLEQKEMERQDSRKLIWSAFFAALGAFGLGIWNWLRSQ